MHLTIAEINMNVTGLLICTLISENQDLEKSGYFFSVCHLNFFQVYGFLGGEKKSRFAGPEIFLNLKQTLIFRNQGAD